MAKKDSDIVAEDSPAPVASSAGVEKPKTSFVPGPERPKAAIVGGVSTRALNSLPEGFAHPEPTAKTPSVRQSIHAAQAKK